MGLTRDAGREILHLLKGLIKGFWAAFCLIYVVVWGWDRLLRKTIKESVFLVSIIGGILSIIESALDLEGLHIIRIPEVLRYVILGATAFLVVVKIREWAGVTP